MKALFAREVPEVSDGTVKIVGVARDPGSRAKVAVISKDRDVDPVGACVGIRGSRIQNIVQELRGERIDIVVWNPEIATYAANALSPSRVSRISVDEEDKALEVVVSDDQLNLAIGRKGQNVKLAAKLLGWKIDIFTESRFREANASKKFLEQLASVAEIPVDNILSAGFETMLAPVIREQYLGQAEVRETFNVPKVGTVAGCGVLDGKLTRNAGVRLVRDGVVVYTGKLTSLKRFKDDVKEVTKGYECGVGLENYNDVKIGDVIEAFESVEERATL